MISENLHRVATIVPDASRSFRREAAVARVEPSSAGRSVPLRRCRERAASPGETRPHVSAADAERWVRDAQRGDVAAFERLYSAYAARIYALCLRMTGHAGDAEDCTQNAFLSAWRSLDQFRAASGFGTWLHRIAVNEVLMAQRRLHPDQDDRADERPAPSARLDVQLDLDTAIAALPTQARHVFVLRAVYGYSHSEVAEWLDIAPGTARAHYFQARDALKRALDRENDDD